MTKQVKAYSGVINAAIFVVMEVAALLMLSGTRSLQDIWINRASHRTHAALWRSGENIRNYFTLDKQNRALAGENLVLAEKVRQYEGKRLAIANGIIADTTQGEYRFIPATIVKASRNSQHNYIILDKGRADGVKPHSGILCSGGVVGVIDAVDEHYSYGLTLMNPLISVSSRIGREGLVAPLVWDGLRTDRGLLKELPMYYDLHPGDTVFTSGFSTIFPPDVPLGTIMRPSEVDGSVQEAVVNLFLDFKSLRYVTIVDNTASEEIAGLEKTEASE